MNNIKNISIKSFLAQRGVTPKTERGGGGMYLSPLRSERTPSFRVDYNKNLWYDFGTSEGGSIIDLVMRLDGVDFRQAVSKLEGRELSYTRWTPPPPSQKPRESPIKVVRVQELSHPLLLNYLRRRAINLDIAREYCREVHYTLYGKQYYAIGFGSDGGGWELRNSYFKGGTTPKSPTIIKGSADGCLLFEGFMDMLAYLTLRCSAHPESSVCVLNSVSNLRQASKFLATQRTIYTLLDNDTAGEKALAEVQKLGAEVIDYSFVYAGHKDVNDYLLSHLTPPS